MTLTKAILHKKEHRKEYHGAKSIDKSCRNHGSDYWEYKNRMHSTDKRKAALDSKEEEYPDLTWITTGNESYDKGFTDGVLFALNTLDFTYQINPDKEVCFDD